MTSTIFIVTHKLFAPPKDQIYQTIIVGQNDLSIKNAYRDNIGKNISHKNSNYCELTALYWIWKNYNDANCDILGLCHYRRFFSKSKYFKSDKLFLSENDVNKILSQYDIILPEKNRWNVTVGEMYYNYGEGKKKDLLLLRKKIIDFFPEYLNDFDKVINEKSASYRNMFITKKKFFNEYCMWLFTLLNELEKDIVLEGYTVAEARIYGYLSEILLNVWVEHQKLKIKHLPIILTEVSTFKLLKMRLRNIPVINNVLNYFGV